MRILIASLATILLTGCASFDQARLAETAVVCAPSLVLSRALTAACVVSEAIGKRRANERGHVK